MVRNYDDRHRRPLVADEDEDMTDNSGTTPSTTAPALSAMASTSTRKVGDETGVSPIYSAPHGFTDTHTGRFKLHLRGTGQIGSASKPCWLQFRVNSPYDILADGAALEASPTSGEARWDSDTTDWTNSSNQQLDFFNFYETIYKFYHVVKFTCKATVRNRETSPDQIMYVMGVHHGSVEPEAEFQHRDTRYWRNKGPYQYVYPENAVHTEGKVVNYPFTCAANKHHHGEVKDDTEAAIWTSIGQNPAYPDFYTIFFGMSDIRNRETGQTNWDFVATFDIEMLIQFKELDVKYKYPVYSVTGKHVDEVEPELAEAP